MESAASVSGRENDTRGINHMTGELQSSEGDHVDTGRSNYGDEDEQDPSDLDTSSVSTASGSVVSEPESLEENAISTEQRDFDNADDEDKQSPGGSLGGASALSISLENCMFQDAEKFLCKEEIRKILNYAILISAFSKAKHGHRVKDDKASPSSRRSVDSIVREWKKEEKVFFYPCMEDDFFLRFCLWDMGNGTIDDLIELDFSLSTPDIECIANFRVLKNQQKRTDCILDSSIRLSRYYILALEPEQLGDLFSKLLLHEMVPILSVFLPIICGERFRAVKNHVINMFKSILCCRFKRFFNRVFYGEVFLYEEWREVADWIFVAAEKNSKESLDCDYKEMSAIAKSADDILATASTISEKGLNCDYGKMPVIAKFSSDILDIMDEDSKKSLESYRMEMSNPVEGEGGSSSGRYYPVEASREDSPCSQLSSNSASGSEDVIFDMDAVSCKEHLAGESSLEGEPQSQLSASNAPRKKDDVYFDDEFKGNIRGMFN